jgi:hypothetical protein
MVVATTLALAHLIWVIDATFHNLYLAPRWFIYLFIRM